MKNLFSKLAVGAVVAAVVGLCVVSEIKAGGLSESNFLATVVSSTDGVNSPVIIQPRTDTKRVLFAEIQTPNSGIMTYSLGSTIATDATTLATVIAIPSNTLRRIDFGPDGYNLAVSARFLSVTNSAALSNNQAHIKLILAN